jgi:hypothetical protein
VKFRGRDAIAFRTGLISPAPAHPEIPPVAGRFVTDDSRCVLNVPHVAEFPELLRGSGVLEDDFVDFERVDVTRLEPMDGQLDAPDELTELLLVVGRDRLACSPTI